MNKGYFTTRRQQLPKNRDVLPVDMSIRHTYIFNQMTHSDRYGYIYTLVHVVHRQHCGKTSPQLRVSVQSECRSYTIQYRNCSNIYQYFTNYRQLFWYFRRWLLAENSFSQLYKYMICFEGTIKRWLGVELWQCVPPVAQLSNWFFVYLLNSIRS